MELKYGTRGGIQVGYTGSNRTFMELKYFS